MTPQVQNSKTYEMIENDFKDILKYIGENPEREGLKDTPKRIIKSFGDLYSGYNQDVKNILTVFEDDNCDEMILLKNIEIYSMCEHHMLPFFGKAHVAYLPDRKIIGISKLARIVEVFSRRLQIQERIGQQVTSALMEYLMPKGAACIIEAQHFCMMARGIQKQNSVMITSSMVGEFRKNWSLKEELLKLVGT